MTVDEELINRDNQPEENDAPDDDPEDDELEAAVRSGDFTAAKQKARSGMEDFETTGDLRADIRAKSRLQALKEEADGEAGGASSPFRAATSKLLQAAWENLVESFGLTLIWIDIHVFLNMVFGDRFFCDLGEEWTSPEMPAAVKK